MCASTTACDRSFWTIVESLLALAHFTTKQMCFVIYNSGTLLQQTPLKQSSDFCLRLWFKCPHSSFLVFVVLWVKKKKKKGKSARSRRSNFDSPCCFINPCCFVITGFLCLTLLPFPCYSVRKFSGVPAYIELLCVTVAATVTERAAWDSDVQQAAGARGWWRRPLDGQENHIWAVCTGQYAFHCLRLGATVVWGGCGSGGSRL